MKKVLLLGASGTIGRATARALVNAGFQVTTPTRDELGGADLSRAMHGMDGVVSCIASRTGVPRDAWAVDHDLNVAALNAALATGVQHFVLLSAICVQKPRLAFQKAKLAFEMKLQAAPISWSIVRPTAFFKSLSGQVDRLRAGKPFLVFGDGTGTACKPISDRDLAAFLVQCLTDPARENRVLPIGGPGPALTPLDQGRLLSEALGQAPKFRHVRPGLLLAVARGLDIVGKVAPGLRDKAELARIGHYYATQSMLVWDEMAGRYDADATPEFGQDRLADHYRALVMGEVADDRGQHAVF